MLSAGRFSLLVLLSLLALCVAVNAQGYRRASGFGGQVEGPLLLAHKVILDSEAVIDTPLTIQVTIFNVGSSPAFDVQLRDSYWIDKNAEVLSSAAQSTSAVAWPVLLAGHNVSHIYTVSPVKGGAVTLQQTHGVVQYSSTNTAEDASVSLTTEVQNYFSILYASESERKARPHFVEWLIFSGLALVTLIAPFLQWKSARKEFNSKF
ncbi:MAG: hypothetical protein Q8P67_05635 [archaeon]|nr:hypothetical protein [archaeon]